MISFLSGVAASVATSPRDRATTTGLQSVQYSRCRQSIPADNTLKNIKISGKTLKIFSKKYGGWVPSMVARLCLCLSVSYWQR